MPSPACPFCKIASTYTLSTKPDLELLSPSAFIVLNSPLCMAFLDIMPLSPGHLLVTTRRHNEKISEVTDEEARDLGRWLPILSRVLANVTGVHDWNIVQNNGAAAAQVVPHVHFHIIPRPALTPELRNRSFTMFGRGQRSELDDGEAADLSRKLREELAREVERLDKKHEIPFYNVHTSALSMMLASDMPRPVKNAGRPRRNTYPPVVASSNEEFAKSEPKRRRRGSADSRPLQSLDIAYDVLRPIFPNIIKERKNSHRRKASETTSLLSKTGILKFIPLGRRQPNNCFHNETPIDGLVRRMQESFNIIDTAQKVPVRVHIPEVYHLSMASFCEDFFERRETSDNTASYRNGFQASALVKSRALDCAHLEDCDLDISVHPIFQEDNWTDTPAHIYQTIQPALRLATKFLTTPYCMQYWLTLLRGNREYCTFTSAIYKVPRNRISRDIPNTPELARATMDDLISLAPTIDLQFHNLSGEIYGKANGHNCHTSQTRLYTDKYHSTPHVKPHIHIHTDFYTAAQKISETRFPDRAQVLRYSLFLAVLLIHELAHVVEMTRQSPNQVGRCEDFIYGHPIAEAGRAWEMQMLGGVLEPINIRCDGLSGLAIKDWPACRGLVDLSCPAEGSEFHTVSMEHVGRYFRKGFWKSIEEKPLDAVGALHIPRDGIHGIGAPMCSTSKEREFEKGDEKMKEDRLQSVLRDILQEGVKVGTQSGVKGHGRSRVSRRRKNIGLGCSRKLIRAKC